MASPALLTIGELSRRTGLSVSAIRFYEARGLVGAIRTGGNQRRFMRSDIRRLSFALIAQRCGLTPFSHGDYEPGRRFYFFDPDGIEYEVISYR